MDPFIAKISFVYAIIARVYRLRKKSKNPDSEPVKVHIPEGMKFLLTWAFIYGFTILFEATLYGTQNIIDKIF
jgi:hypothetical protein